MSARDQARAEAAFMRGDTGVDGQSTEEQVDQAEVERGKARDEFLRGKAFLGRELLTWLLWRSESSEPLLEHDGKPLTVIFTDRLALKGIAGEVTEVAARGAMAPYSSLVRESLDRGLLIHSARLRLTLGEQAYELTLDAEFLDVKSAKLPELMTEEEDDRLQERLYLVEQLSAMLDAVVAHFLRLRTSQTWSKETVPELKAWMHQGAPRPEGCTCPCTCGEAPPAAKAKPARRGRTETDG